MSSSDALALVLYLLLPLILLWPGLAGGQTLVPGDVLFTTPPWSALAEQYGVDRPKNELTSDLVLQNYPWKRLARDAISQGEIPLWNPYLFAGAPFLATAQSSSLYPLSLPFFLLLPIAFAYTWVFALHLFIAGMGTYVYLRVLGTRRWGALLGGVAYCLAGPLTVNPQWPQAYGVMAWLPPLMICLELALRLQGWSRVPVVLAGATAVALQFLAGHPELSFYLLFTGGAYVIARLAMDLRGGRSVPSLFGDATACLSIPALGALLAAVQLVPFLEVASANYRAGGTDLDAARSWALPLYHIAAFLVPDFFGNPAQHIAWGPKNYVEGAAYMGVLPLLLALPAALTLSHKGRGDAWLGRRGPVPGGGQAPALPPPPPSTSSGHAFAAGFFSFYAIFSLLLAFGTPVYGLFLLAVPGFDQLHTPFRWVFPYSFAIAIVAAQGFDTLLARPPRIARLLGGAALAAGLFVLACTPFLGGVFSSRLAGSQGILAAFGSSEAFFAYQSPNLMLLGGLLALSGAAFLLMGRHRWAPALVVAVTAADLLHFGVGFIAFHDPSQLETVPPVLQRLAQQPGPFRIVTYGPQKLLPPNSAMLAGIQDTRGYDSIIPRSFVDYWRRMEEPSGLSYSQIDRLNDPRSLESPLMGALNVRYVLTDRPLDLAHLRLVDQGDGLLVYENLKALPRAYAVFDAHPTNDDEGVPPLQSIQPAHVINYALNQVTVRTMMQRTGYLVLADAHAPGWQAKDAAGKGLPVERAYGLFRAVRLDPGDHTVTFSYAPDSLKLGLYLTFLGVIVVGVAAAVFLWRRLVPSGIQGTATQRVARNTVTPMAAQLVARAVDLGFAIFMLRVLGPAEYGGYAVAGALIGYFSIFTDFGLGTLLTREVARVPAGGRGYLGNTMALRLLLGLAGAPVLGLLAWVYHTFFGLPETAAFAAVLLMVAVGPGSVAGALSALCSAYERMEYPAAVVVFTSLVKSFLGILVLLLGWGVLGLGLAAVATNAMTALVLWILVSRLFFPPRLSFDPSSGLRMLRTSVPLVLNSLLNTMFFRIDILLLQAIKNAEAVGIYSTAYKFVDALIIIPSALTLALFPLMSRQAGVSREDLLRTYSRGLRILLLVAVPLSLVMTIIATDLIVLLFGPAYRDAGPVLQLLIWFLPFSYVNGLTQYVLIALDRQRFITGVFAGATAFNLVANLLVLPTYGPHGAAAVTVLSEIVLLVPFLKETTRLIGWPALSPLGLKQDLGLLTRLLKRGPP